MFYRVRDRHKSYDPLNKMKDKNHIIISTYAKNAFDRFQHSFIIKTQWGKAKVFSLRSGTRQGCLFSPLLLNIVLEVLATVIRQQKEIKGI